MSTRKTVLITGAGSGIGRAMAIEGARRGYALILTGRTVPNLEATRDMIGAGDVTLVPGDVTTREGRAAMVAATQPEAVAFVVSVAGPGVRGDALMVRQMEDLLKAAKASPEAIQAQLGPQRALMTALTDGSDEAAVDAAVAPHRKC